MSTCPWLHEECICTARGAEQPEVQQWRFTNDWYYEDQRGVVFTGVLTDIPNKGGRSPVYLGITTQQDIPSSKGDGNFSKGELIWVFPREVEEVTS